MVSQITIHAILLLAGAIVIGIGLGAGLVFTMKWIGDNFGGNR